MDSAEFCRIVERITYKPGWDISVKPLDEGLMVLVEAKVVDKNPPHEIVPFFTAQTYSYKLMYRCDEATVVMMVRSVIMGAEKHEFDEWMRYKGKQWQDPHAQGLGSEEAVG